MVGIIGDLSRLPTERGAARGGRAPARALALALLALLTASGCKPLDDAMVAVFGRSMRDQRSFDPYENTRGAPENSVAFASANYPAAPGDVNLGQPEGADVPPFTQFDLGVPGVGGEVIQGLVNPIDPSDPADQARGEELYLRFCVVCHGPDGVGANAYIADKHVVLPAYNISGAAVAAYSDQYIYAMIRVGRAQMPEYGSRITHFDRWRVVNYVRELQRDAGNLAAGDVPAGEADLDLATAGEAGIRPAGEEAGDLPSGEAAGGLSSGAEGGLLSGAAGDLPSGEGAGG